MRQNHRLANNPQRRVVYTLFFAVYGGALQAPAQYADFLEPAGAEVMDALRRAQGPARVEDAAEYLFDALEHRVLGRMTRSRVTVCIAGMPSEMPCTAVEDDESAPRRSVVVDLVDV